MNPLARYLLSMLKNEKVNNSRRYLQVRDALNEVGYWCLERPASYSREQMPSCKISQECNLIDEFPCYNPPFDIYEGFAVMVDVYADPFVVDGL